MRPLLRLLRHAAALGAAAALAGCAALTSLDTASRSLDTFELTPVAPQTAVASGGGRALLLDEPSASPALATDRILIKPTALRVAYLPDGRWVEPAPQHVQTLLRRSVANTGRIGFVTTRAAGPLPDYVLLTDLEAFQAEAGGAEGQPPSVLVRMTLTLVRDIDRRIVATRRFERRAIATDTTAAALVPAFNAAMTPLLGDATGWIVGTLSAGV